MLPIVAVAAEHSQITVALMTKPRVGAVVHIQRPATPATLTAIAGKRERARPARPPVGGTQVLLAVPRP